MRYIFFHSFNFWAKTFCAWHKFKIVINWIFLLVVLFIFLLNILLNTLELNFLIFEAFNYLIYVWMVSLTSKFENFIHIFWVFFYNIWTFILILNIDFNFKNLFIRLNRLCIFITKIAFMILILLFNELNSLTFWMIETYLILEFKKQRLR